MVELIAPRAERHQTSLNFAGEAPLLLDVAFILNSAVSKTVAYHALSNWASPALLYALYGGALSDRKLEVVVERVLPSQILLNYGWREAPVDYVTVCKH